MISQGASDLVKRILRTYGTSFDRILPSQKGYRNQSFPIELSNGVWANLILYKSEPGILAKIKAANDVSGFLFGLNFPVRHMLDPRIIRLQAHDRIKYGAVYSYLPGDTIPWEAYTKDHLKQLGRTMSDMHFALQQFDPKDLPEAADEYLAIVKRMRTYFESEPVSRAIATKLGLTINSGVFAGFDELLKVCRDLPNKQALHMDFVRSNILFKDNAHNSLKVDVSGILDFEKTAYGHPILDIARTLSFLLVDCKYKQPGKVRKYFIDSGYNKRGAAKLPTADKASVEQLVDLFLFYDFYKFLRHNPYEYLPQNEHFMRTKTLLLKRQLISEHTVK